MTYVQAILLVGIVVAFAFGVHIGFDANARRIRYWRQAAKDWQEMADDDRGYYDQACCVARALAAAVRADDEVEEIEA